MKIEVSFDNIWAKINGEPTECLDLVMKLDESLGCQVWAAKGNGDDKPGELYVMLGAMLEMGLVSELKDSALFDPAEASAIRDAADALVAAGHLRDYQGRMAAEALLAPYARGILACPPGGGKTRICAAICVIGGLVGLKRWHYVVTNNELANQAITEIKNLLDPMLEIFSAKEMGLKLRITSSSYAKLHKVVTEGLLVDECHTLSADNRTKRYAQCKTKFRLGLSGTPLDRMDSRNARTIGLLGPIVTNISRQELVAMGYLAPSQVKKLVIDETGNVKQR